MNTSKTFTTLLTLALAALAIGTMAAAADNKPATAATGIRSVFVLPSSTKEGRDPFFPESTRVADALAQAAATKPVDITTLTVRGISGTSGHLLAIINNHTFAVGEEADMQTSSGRTHVRCVEIHTDSVLVEINGQMRRLGFDTQ